MRKMFTALSVAMFVTPALAGQVLDKDGKVLLKFDTIRSNTLGHPAQECTVRFEDDGKTEPDGTFVRRWKVSGCAFEVDR